MPTEAPNFFAGLGTVLLEGLSKGIDGEVLQRYGTYGGQVVADTQGNTVPAGTPFTDTVSDLGSAQNVILIAAAVLLGLLLFKQLGK